MKYNILFLSLLLALVCNSQNNTNQNSTPKTTENDSIWICTFSPNCGYYKGEIANGKAYGKGRAALKEGIAEGEWYDNKLDGIGTYESKYNYKYSGEWLNGLFHGKGTLTNSNRSKYIGDWKSGYFNGEGIFYTAKRIKYNCNWNVVQTKALGYIIFAKGNKTESKVLKFNGSGILIALNGNIYEGSFKDGLFNGQGTIYGLNHANKYTGLWKDGKKNGYGIAFKDGIKYSGLWKNDKLNGKGTSTNSISGDIYDGNWKEDQMSGQGTMRYGNKEKFVGQWKNNKELNGILYDPNGKIKYTFKDGEKKK